MPAQSNLFKVLADDPKALEDEIGCMTGIFQIFDRSQAFTGRRYGSKRVTSTAGNDQLLLLFDGREEARSSLDLPRSSSKVRDGPRFSVDGTKDPPRASLSPRLSVDGRDSPHACGIPPRLKLDERESIQSSKLSKGGDASQPKKEYNAAEADGQVETHRRMSNVVARLMGLEALPGSDPSHMISPVKVPETSPSSRDVRLLQGLVEYNTTPKVSPPPPPPPRQSDDYNYKQQETEGFQQLKQRPIQRHDMQLSFMSSSSSSSSQGSSQKETRPQSLLQEPLYTLMDKEMRQLRIKNSVQGRTMLRHILEAMQLKGLLHSPRRKQSEDIKKTLQTAKPVLEESKSRMQTLKQQFLPAPRLMDAIPKEKNAEAEHQDIAGTEFRKDLPMMETKMHNAELIIDTKQTKSSYEKVTANGRMSRVQTLTSSGSLHEPNGLNSSDTEAVTPPRMSRKERIAARSVKGSLDALQVGRDVSPKSPQLSPLPQGKNRLSFPIKEANPLKPGSPRRCVTGNGGAQLVENGKPPSRPFMVKDREDSKPMLLTMRAQSTKQDFLKGRASAGPDSPRPRRSSSDCKLISRMAEKLNATDTAVSSKAQSRRVPSEVAILRSKRSTSKQSTPAVKPRTPSHAQDNQTVPADTSTKEKSNFQNEVKSVAATDGTERDKSNGTNLMIELSQANPPAESRLDLPVPLAPSPVSVLDNSHFQEEDLTPSQRPSKSSPIDSLEDAFESPQRDHLEEAQAALNGLADIIGCTKDLSNQEFLHLNKQRVEIQLPIDSVPGTDLPSNSHGICLWDKDEEREYVRDILVASGVTDYCLQWTGGYIMDLTHFGDLESNRRHQQQPSNTKENDAHYERLQTCSEKEALGRRVLFDATNEILVQKLDPWIGRDQPQLQQKPARQHQLVQEIWDELQHVPCVQSEDVCDTLYTILLKDLHKTAKQWTGMDGELGEISLEVERMIVKELIEEIVKDLASGFCSSCHLSTKPIEPVARRQLFAP
ncbi:unnamed protein product [Sphagnum troendelagicum]|uniref:DUF4378 domain-containing protein n=1 Tax=Sphagnum troendelagicum TaxID=128251 RepID=A0ABP0UAK6_9BRYO